MKQINVTPQIIQEARNIEDKVYSPLEGFLTSEELENVLSKMRLPSGEIWPMPVVLDISKQEAENLKNENEALIVSGANSFTLIDLDIYLINKKELAEKLFGTIDKNHPGVEWALNLKDYALGGKIIESNLKSLAFDYYLSPSKTKEIFKKYGWENVVAFQTRNPPHLSHEFLQKEALKEAEGLFIHPIIGPKKKGDFQDSHILGAYNILIKKYYQPGQAAFGTFHTFMRYAGPKEAVFHALVRRNFGCTHMIIGRDHAGANGFYGPFDAQKIFDNFTEEELGVKILKYDNAAFCNGCGKVVFNGECQHSNEEKIFLSGTELRQRLEKKLDIPEGFMRKEIIDYLVKNKDSLFV